MAVKRKKTGADISVPVGISIGVAISTTVMLLGTLMLAYLVLNETVSGNQMGLAASCILLLSTALGCWIAAILTKQKKLLVCGITALALFLILLSITAVFFDGTFSGVGRTAFVILLGAGVALLPGLRRKSRKTRIKIPAYR